jgi:hypothetical protein
MESKIIMTWQNLEVHLEAQFSKTQCALAHLKIMNHKIIKQQAQISSEDLSLKYTE